MNKPPERKKGLDLATLMIRIFDSGLEKQARSLKLLRVLEDDEDTLDFIAKCLFDPRFTAKDEALKTLLAMSSEKAFPTFFSFLDQFAARTRERFIPVLAEPISIKAILKRILVLTERSGTDAVSERKKLVSLMKELPRETILYGLICCQDWDDEPSADLFEILVSAGKDEMWDFITKHKDLGDPVFLVRAAKALGAVGASSRALELMYLLPPEVSETFSHVPSVNLERNNDKGHGPQVSGGAPSRTAGAESSLPDPSGESKVEDSSGSPAPNRVPVGSQTNRQPAVPGQVQNHPQAVKPTPEPSRPPTQGAPPPQGQDRKGGDGGADFMSGDIVFREGEVGKACYIVKSGMVKVCKSDKDGNEITLANLGVNEIFGEMAIIDGTPRSATVVATEDTVLLTVTEENFEKVFVKNPEFSLKMLKILVNRLRKSSEIIKQLEDRVSAAGK